MQSAIKRLGLTSAACAAVSLSILSGCEKLEGDSARAGKKAEAALSQAVRQSDKPQAARSALELAAGETAAPAEVRVRAKSGLAADEQRQGERLMAQADRAQVELNGWLWQIDQIGARIAANNQAIADFKLLEPKQLLADAQSRVDAAQGSADKPTWMGEGSGAIASADALAKQVANLQSQIDKINEQIKQVSAQRAELVKQADEASRQSDLAKDQKSVDLYTQASNQRKQAADLAVQVAGLNAQLVPLQQDLAVAQGQSKQLAEAIGQLKGQAAEATKGWEAVSKLIEARQAANKALLEGANGEKGINGLAADVAKLAEQIKADRDKAQQALSNARQHYADAKTAADTLKTELNTRMNQPSFTDDPRVAAWKKYLEVFNPQEYQFSMATVDRSMGMMFSNQAMGLTARIRLAKGLGKTLGEAGLTMPKELEAADLSAARDSAAGEADKHFASAEDLYKSIAQMAGTNTARKNAAIGAHILTNYAWGQLKMAMGDPGAGEKLNDAKTEATSAIIEGVMLPTLPAGMGITVPVAAGAADAATSAPAAPAPLVSPATQPME